MRRARWKKKPLRPNLPVRASLGMRTVESHDRIKPARSHPGALHLGNHPAFKPQVVTLPQIPGCLSKRLTFGPAAAPGMDSKGRGRSPFLLVVQERGPGGNPAERVSPWPLFGGDPFLSVREMGRICPAIIMAVAQKRKAAPWQPFFQNSPTWSGSTSPPMVRSCWAFSFHSRSAMAIFRMMFFTVWSRAVPSE